MAKELAEFKLTDKQARFVDVLLATGDEATAMAEAGYVGGEFASVAARVTRSPELLAAIQMAVGRRLIEGAPIALKVLQDMVKDTGTPGKLRLDAAKTLLDRAGHVAPRAKQADSGAGKALNEMSIDELREQHDRLEAEIANRAKPVNAPGETGGELDSADLLR